MAIDMKNLMAEVRERGRKWSGCQRHFFPHKPEGYRIGEKVRCQHCEVDASLVDIGNYIRGYMARGGSPEDIMPDWKPLTNAAGNIGVVARFASRKPPSAED